MTCEKIVVVSDAQIVASSPVIAIVQPAPTAIIETVKQVVLATVPETKILSVGLQGPPGVSGGALALEDLTSFIDGSNRVFTLSRLPNILLVFLNGLLLRDDFSLAGMVVTISYAPMVGDSLIAFYSYGG